MNPRDIIDKLGLSPLPREGGFFRETFRSGERLAAEALPDRYGSARSIGTAIYYLLTPETRSALHRLSSDEVYHFYLGDPVELLLLHPGGTTERRVLGPRVLEGDVVQTVIPRGAWQGSRLVPGGACALLGATVAPGFEIADYEHGRLDQLVRDFPAEAGLIRALLA